MTVLAFVSARARDRVASPAAVGSVARGRHAAPVVWSSPGPLAGRSHHVRVYHPALTPMQRRAHLSSLMTRSACALWTGLASAPLAAAAVVTSASGSQAAPTFAAATIAACTGGLAAWIRAGRGARAVAAHLQVLHPGEPVLATVRSERLSDTLGLTASKLDRSGAQGVQARQAVWTAARARRVTRRR